MNFDPTKQNLRVWKGSTFRKRWYLHQGDETTPVQDVTGWAAVMNIFDKHGGILLLSPTVIIGGTAGYFEATIPAATVLTQTWKKGYYELLITDTSGDTSALLYGGISIWGVEVP